MGMVNMANSPLEDEVHDEKSEPTANLSNLIQQEIMKIMKRKLSVEGNSIQFTNLDGYAGNLACLNHALHIALSTSNLIRSGAWILDTGATHHLTPDLENLTLHSNYQGTDAVKIGNGKSLPITKIVPLFIFLMVMLINSITFYMSLNHALIYYLSLLSQILMVFQLNSFLILL